MSGGPQHQLSRLLRGCKVEELSEEQARQVGGLIARSGLDDTVELAVAEGALCRNDAVVTSDRTHITQVADAVGKRIAMHDVWRPAGDLENGQPQHRSDVRAACTLEQSLGSFADSAQLYDGLLARSGEELISSFSMATCSVSSGADVGHASAGNPVPDSMIRSRSRDQAYSGGTPGLSGRTTPRFGGRVDDHQPRDGASAARPPARPGEPTRRCSVKFFPQRPIVGGS